MGKSIRSKIKRYWRAELRNTVGKAHLQKQEAHIQDQLKKSLEKQGGGSILKLSQQLGSVAKPVVSESLSTEMNVEDEATDKEETKGKGVRPIPRKKKKKSKKFAFYVVKKKGA